MEQAKKFGTLGLATGVHYGETQQVLVPNAAEELLGLHGCMHLEHFCRGDGPYGQELMLGVYQPGANVGPPCAHRLHLLR
jgi:hypothetical protein